MITDSASHTVQQLTWRDIEERASVVASRILEEHFGYGGSLSVYPVPRGGIPAAQAVVAAWNRFPCATENEKRRLVLELTDKPTLAEVFVDDIIDSSKTKDYHIRNFGKPFYALIDKTETGSGDPTWYSFPWERMSNEAGPEENIRRIIEFVGDDPNRDGLKETPQRVVKSYAELYGGYKVDVASIFKTFDDIPYDEMVVLRDIDFYSNCVVGSTFVETPRGRIPISKLEDGEFIYAWDEDQCSMVITRASKPRVTGRNKRLYRVYTDKDSILCTGKHKFLTHNRGWVKAKNLTPGDSIVALNKGTVVTNEVPRTHITWTGNSKQIPEHRFIYEQVNGGIELGDHIHHINGEPNDNRPENLTSLSPSEHSRLHRLRDEITGFALFTDQQRREMRAKQTEGIKRSQTEEVRRKRSESLKRYWGQMTPEERAERNHRVLLVEKTEWREDVWCMDVPQYENFVANGMVVHNCEHHMQPFFGKVHVSYVPRGPKVIGLSKMARLVEVFARRLQVQERMTQQIADAMVEGLDPLGAACIVQAKHFCMMCRGARQQNAEMITSALRGVMRDKPEARMELLALTR